MYCEYYYPGNIDNVKLLADILLILTDDYKTGTWSSPFVKQNVEIFDTIPSGWSISNLTITDGVVLCNDSVVYGSAVQKYISLSVQSTNNTDYYLVIDNYTIQPNDLLNDSAPTITKPYVQKAYNKADTILNSNDANAIKIHTDGGVFYISANKHQLLIGGYDLGYTQWSCGVGILEYVPLDLFYPNLQTKITTVVNFQAENATIYSNKRYYQPIKFNQNTAQTTTGADAALMIKSSCVKHNLSPIVAALNIFDAVVVQDDLPLAAGALAWAAVPLYRVGFMSKLLGTFNLGGYVAPIYDNALCGIYLLSPACGGNNLDEFVVTGLTTTVPKYVIWSGTPLTGNDGAINNKFRFVILKA
jgi:hypothetical protein